MKWSSSPRSVRPRRRPRAEVPRLLLAAGAAAALSLGPGCVRWLGGPAGGDPAAHLARFAMTPAEAGLRIETAGGHSRLRPLNLVLRREESRLDFSIRMDVDRPHPLVRTRVNGFTTLALLDSGSTVTLVDWRAAQRMGVIPLRWPDPPGGAGTSRAPRLMTADGQGLGARFQGYLGLIRNLQLGGLTVSNVLAGIVDSEFGLGNRGWMAGQRVEMLLGAEVLQSCCESTFDFPNEQFRIGSWFGTAPAGVADARLIGTGPVPVIEIEMSEGNRIPAALDSGGDFGLWIPWELARKIGLPTPPSGARGLSGIGVGGTTYAVPLGSLPLRIGGHDMGPVPVAVDTLGGRNQQLPYALIGLDVLEGYEVSLDYTLGLARFRRR